MTRAEAVVQIAKINEHYEKSRITESERFYKIIDVIGQVANSTDTDMLYIIENLHRNHFNSLSQLMTERFTLPHSERCAGNIAEV